jgi:hypothetical protein
LLLLQGFAASQEVLYLEWVSNHSTWKYWDKNTWPANSWYLPSYDDSGWLSGPGLLGAGQAGMQTTLPKGEFAYNTYYFRTTFDVDDPSRVVRMSYGIDYDDAFIMYLNGHALQSSNPSVDWYRHETTTGIVHNWAGDLKGPTEPRYPHFDLTEDQMQFLVPGKNTLAVAVKQWSSTSSDAALMMSLYGYETKPPSAMSNLLGGGSDARQGSGPGWETLFYLALGIGLLTLLYYIGLVRMERRQQAGNAGAAQPSSVGMSRPPGKGLEGDIESRIKILDEEYKSIESIKADLRYEPPKTFTPSPAPPSAGDLRRRLDTSVKGQPDNMVLLISTKTENHTLLVNGMLDILINKRGMGGIYISVSQPYEVIVQGMKAAGIPVKDVHFIDCISRTAGKMQDKQENVVFVENPSSLEEVSMHLGRLLAKVGSGKKFIVLDSLSSLLIYNTDKVVKEFTHFVINRIRLDNTAGVIMSIEKKEAEDLVKTLAPMCNAELRF